MFNTIDVRKGELIVTIVLNKICLLTVPVLASLNLNRNQSGNVLFVDGTSMNFSLDEIKRIKDALQEAANLASLDVPE